MSKAAYDRYWAQQSHARISAYTEGGSSWIVGLLPERAVQLIGTELFAILERRLGAEVVEGCLDPEYTHPSPVAERPDGSWLTDCNTVGVNVRTIGSFLEVVKYALTLPAHIRGIHLLPVWEPGVVGSLYGMASWQLNPEFYSQELYELGVGGLQHQLKVTVNLLHAMGKVVGMDVIPHTDRYSEMVLANPDHFEWLRRHDTEIVDHGAYLHERVQGVIYDWLLARGPAVEAYAAVGHLWFLPEAKRLRLFFGEPEDYLGRQRRRIDLVDWLYQHGYEPVPATMAPPYRGLEVDPSPEAMTVDAAGREWRDYRITRPQAMSRVFGPLTRYKLYGRKVHNRNWEIDFERPRGWVWEYLTQRYADQQARYNFDFMRGDMSHVQMRPGGVPDDIDLYYDPLGAVKLKIRQKAPYFAYFAESFLAPDGYMAYGSEVKHLERSQAEATLGNLQSTVPGSQEFWDMLRHYFDIKNNYSVTPAWTVITGDKDDPRFDQFHHWGELERLFTGIFLGLLPMYFSLGFEQRDRHFIRAKNEVYSKLYVFQEERGEKAVSGPFRWGNNLLLFAAWTKLHRFAEGTLPHLGDPRPLLVGEESHPVLSWVRPASDGDGTYLFVAAFSRSSVPACRINNLVGFTAADLLFTGTGLPHHTLPVVGGSLSLENVASCRCYRLG